MPKAASRTMASATAARTSHFVLFSVTESHQF
jgi:hypothetical protein